MNETKICETLNSLRNEMTHLWTSFFIVGGGSLALLFNNPNGIKVVFGIVGAVISLFLLNAYFIKRDELINIIKNIGE